MTAGAADFVAYWREVSGCIDAEFAHSPVASTARPLLTAGKHLRGTLTCLVAQACGAPRHAALPYALAIEAIQAASLIHDDYIDGDTRRHGRPALWTDIGARRAVLLGDVLFADAIEKTARRSPVACRIIARAIAATARGAYHEPLTHAELNRVRDRRLYHRIVRGKTGALFAAAAALGTVAACASNPAIRAAYAYGLRLGEAYQIADDVHDLAIAAASGAPKRLAPAVRLALRSFVDDAVNDSGATGVVRQWLLDAARAAMQTAAADRRARARRHLRAFADPDYAALLHVAPDAMGALLTDDAQSPRAAVMTADP